LFVLSFAESSFFPIPPDILLIALALSMPSKALYFAGICSVASVLGGMAGYGIGWGLWEVVQNLFFDYVPGFSHQAFEKIKGKYELYNFWVVFTAGFTPIPYKVITISAGVFKVNFPVFVFASAASRSARFFLVGWLIYKYGAPVKGFIDRYFNVLTIVFTVLLIGGFVLIKLVSNH
jgi:membrane protein YqaA with SNARE-associated domain